MMNLGYAVRACRRVVDVFLAREKSLDLNLKFHVTHSLSVNGLRFPLSPLNSVKWVMLVCSERCVLYFKISAEARRHRCFDLLCGRAVGVYLFLGITSRLIS